jgi:two-component sensor histidine kinase
MATHPEGGVQQSPRPDQSGWSLRGRLLLALTIALLPIAAVIVLQGMERARLDSENVRERLIQSARASSTEEQNIIASAEQLLRAVSHIGDVRDMTKECNPILTDALRGVTYFLNLSRLDAKGTVVCSALRQAVGLSGATSDVFIAASKSGEKMSVGKLTQSTILNRPVIPAMLPIFDAQGTFNGTVAIVLDVRSLDHIMRSSEVPKDAVLAVFDSDGTIVSSNNPGIAKAIFPPGLKQGLHEGEWISGADADGNKWSYAVSALVEKSVFVGFAMRDQELFGQTYIHMGIDLLLPFAMLGIAWVAIWIATERQVTQWIFYLRRIAAAYRSGHYSIRPQLKGAPPEFTLLGDAMSDMAGAIQDRDRRLRDAVGMKTVLIKEIHHRVKNNLQIVMSLLSLQANQVKEPLAREALMQAQTRINALALVHRILNDIEDQTTVDVKRLLEELCQQIAEGMGDNHSIRIETDVMAREVPGSVAVPVALFTVEALTNIFKHAYPDNKTGIIRVSLKPEGPGNLKLTIEDDGIGFSLGNGGRSVGSRLIENFGRQLGGTSIVHSDAGKGTMVELVFPTPDTQGV